MRSCCITPNFHTISEIWVYKRIVQVPEAFCCEKRLFDLKINIIFRQCHLIISLVKKITSSLDI